MRYNWQQKDWPDFRYDIKVVEPVLWTYAEKTARLSGQLELLPPDQRTAAVIEILTAEAMKTAAIEGELLDREDVQSSIRNQLGLNPVPEVVHDLRVIGLGQMMADVRQTYSGPLSEEDLFRWHRMLLSYRSDLEQIGSWRQHEAPMQIVSGPLGRQKVHFEAPPSEAVPGMMIDFLRWFNRSSDELDRKLAPIRSALAHLYFESIHPFEDGNGRIGRAVAEKALSQALQAPAPFSISRAIEADKKAYYHALERAQRSNEVTEWLKYFLLTLIKATEDTEAEVLFIARKARYFDRFRDQINERQLKAIRRMFAEGPSGRTGGMNTRKYVGITGVSKATATRDLQYLQEIGALRPIGEGRGRRYELGLEPNQLS